MAWTEDWPQQEDDIEQRYEGGEGFRREALWGKSLPGQGLSCAEAMRLCLLSRFRELQGSWHGWCRVREGTVVGDEKRG